MTTALPIAPHARPEDEATARQLLDAIAALPVEAQDAVRDQFFLAAARFGSTGELDPLLHFVRGLLLTAQLHRLPDYSKGDAGDDFDGSDQGRRSVTELLDDLRAQRHPV